MRYFAGLLFFASFAMGAPQGAAKSPEQAEAAWKSALRASPDSFPALFNLGYFYFSQQRFSDATSLLHRAAAAEPGNFNAHYLLGMSQSKLGRLEQALRAWKEALRIQPGNLRLMQIMSVEYSKGRYFVEAAALAKQALRVKKDDLQLYLLAIKAYQDAGDNGSAREIALEAVARFPDSGRANFEYGFQLQNQGKVEEALVYLERAMKAEPAYEEPFFFYANLLVNQERSKEAVPYLRTAIKNRNDYVPARVLLARALMNLQQWPDAIAELNDTIALDPKQPQPHLLLSQIYFRQGDEARAKAEKEESLRLRRKTPGILEGVQSRSFPADSP